MSRKCLAICGPTMYKSIFCPWIYLLWESIFKMISSYIYAFYFVFDKRFYVNLILVTLLNFTVWQHCFTIWYTV